MKRILLFLLIVVVLLTACAFLENHDSASPKDPSIFTQESIPSESLTAETKDGSDLGGLSYGLVSRTADGRAPEQHYTGGEMSMDFFIQAHGLVGRKGLGLLLFLDGRPQPYRLDGETEDSYLHTFYLDDETVEPVLYFTPVTGQSGDVLEMASLLILNPEYLPSKGNPGMMTHTTGSLGYSFLLYVDSDPGEAKIPEKLTLLSEPEITYEPCSYADVAQWSDDDFLTKVGHASEVNGMENGLNIFDNFHKEQLDLKYSLWGTTLVHYTVVYFLNNEPLYLPDGSCLDLEVQEGMKTVIRLTIDTSTLTGEDVVYAVLVPRNSRLTDLSTMAFIKGEREWFLLAGDMPNQ